MDRMVYPTSFTTQGHGAKSYIKKILAKLPAHQFIRVHRPYVVPLNKIGIWNTPILEAESLSNDAILMIVEMRHQKDG